MKLVLFFLFRLVLLDHDVSILYAMSQVGNELNFKLKRQRYTVESGQCKKFWMLNGKMIHGCTTKIDPDGMQEKEWC